jgi:hypothetical protein
MKINLCQLYALLFKESLDWFSTGCGNLQAVALEKKLSPPGPGAVYAWSNP